MYSIFNKKRTLVSALLTIAFAGVIFPAGAIALPTPAKSSFIKASQSHPAMAIPGDIVVVTLKTGVTQVQLVGPRTAPVIASALPGEFDLTFTQKRGRTLINIRDFGILDGNATLIRPIEFDNGVKEFTLKAGETRTEKITEIMADGTGTFRWAPLGHYVSDWQFVEEAD